MRATFALYKPIAKGDWDGINVVASASKVFYQKSGILFLVLLIGLSVVYPRFVSVDSLAPWEIIVLTFLLGAKIVVDFFSLAKYQVFLTADQKNWLIQLASTVFTLVTQQSFSYSPIFMLWLLLSTRWLCLRFLHVA